MDGLRIGHVWFATTHISHGYNFGTSSSIRLLRAGVGASLRCGVQQHDGRDRQASITVLVQRVLVLHKQNNGERVEIKHSSVSLYSVPCFEETRQKTLKEAWIHRLQSSREYHPHLGPSEICIISITTDSTVVK